MAEIKLDARELVDFRDRLAVLPQELAIAQVRALNKTATQGRNQIRRTIPLNLPEKRKNQAIGMRRATRRKPEASVGSWEILTPLTWFKGWREVRQYMTFRAATRRSTGATARRRAAGSGTTGLYVRWEKGGPIQHIPDGFILRRRGGAQGRAFMRAPEALASVRRGRYFHHEIDPTDRLVGRLPIWPIYGPSVYDEFVERLRLYEKKLGELYEVKLGQELTFLVRKRIGAL